jgi:putative transposase
LGIAQGTWLFFRFSLSLRLVEEMLLECGIVVSCGILGKEVRPGLCRPARRKAPLSSDIWHLDEVAGTIGR